MGRRRRYCGWSMTRKTSLVGCHCEMFDEYPSHLRICKSMTQDVDDGSCHAEEIVQWDGWRGAAVVSWWSLCVRRKDYVVTRGGA
jgi:hypothetical protein